MTNELLLAAATGLIVGWGYFGGLWLTLQRLGRYRRPHRIALIGFALRTGAALGVFVLVCGKNPAAWGMTLPGFLLARIWWCRKMKA